MSRLVTLLGGIGVSLASGFVGYHLHAPSASVMESVTAAPEVRQSDGSVMPERTPEATPAPPPHELPKGAKEERRVGVTIKPKQKGCEPVHVDLSLVQLDGGRRVVVSSPDGEVAQSIDIPIIPALIPAPSKRWAAGTSYDPFGERYGAWVERELGRFRVGLDIKQSDHGTAEGWVRVGFTF